VKIYRPCKVKQAYYQIFVYGHPEKCMYVLNQLEEKSYQHLIRIIKPIRVDMKSECKKRRI
jgi:hypothetical protein